MERAGCCCTGNTLPIGQCGLQVDLRFFKSDQMATDCQGTSIYIQRLQEPDVEARSNGLLSCKEDAGPSHDLVKETRLDRAMQNVALTCKVFWRQILGGDFLAFVIPEEPELQAQLIVRATKEAVAVEKEVGDLCFHRREFYMNEITSAITRDYLSVTRIANTGLSMLASLAIIVPCSFLFFTPSGSILDCNIQPEVYTTFLILAIRSTPTILQ